MDEYQNQILHCHFHEATPEPRGCFLIPFSPLEREASLLTPYLPPDLADSHFNSVINYNYSAAEPSRPESVMTHGFLEPRWSGQGQDLQTAQLGGRSMCHVKERGFFLKKFFLNKIIISLDQHQECEDYLWLSAVVVSL